MRNLIAGNAPNCAISRPNPWKILPARRAIHLRCHLLLQRNNLQGDGPAGLGGTVPALYNVPARLVLHSFPRVYDWLDGAIPTTGCYLRWHSYSGCATGRFSAGGTATLCSRRLARISRASLIASASYGPHILLTPIFRFPSVFRLDDSEQVIRIDIGLS